MAVFGTLAEKLQNTLGKLRGRGKLTEQDVKEALREVRLALLEADVNYKVVRGLYSPGPGAGSGTGSHDLPGTSPSGNQDCP
jgi:hypothetical protein